MPYVTSSDDVRLYVEETGKGHPLLFIHEFAGDHRSWEPQVRFFSRSYRCITYAARGFQPSDVPEHPHQYSQEHAVRDAVAVLEALHADRAHVVGISMGGFTALRLALAHPDLVSAMVVAGCGYGSEPAHEPHFRAECDAIAAAFESTGAAEVAKRYALGPARVQFQNKDPRGWQEFATQLGSHSSTGSALTMRGVQGARPSLYLARDDLARLRVPTLIVCGDEDEGCLEPDLMLKRTIKSSGLLVLPQTGHTANLEEPDLFNRSVAEFLHRVETCSWQMRDDRSLSSSTTGMT